MSRTSALLTTAAIAITTLTLTSSPSEAAPVQPRQPLCLAVPGGSSGETAVINITNTDASRAGFGALRSSNARSIPTRPAADQFSSVNFAPGLTQPNLAFVTIGNDGRICYDSDGGSANVILDLAATIPATSINTLEPQRLIDTRDAPAPAPTPTPAPPTTQPPADVMYQNCTEVRAADADPIRRGDPGYSRRLDRDGDGIGCE